MIAFGTSVRRYLESFLENLVMCLMTALAALVVIAVAFRKAGAALVWYDEVAAILLAWLTYYGAALAALHKAHIGFPRGTSRLPFRVQRSIEGLRTAIVLAFFVILAWAGWRVLQVVSGTFLVSLPWVPRTIAQSVIPIGALLFVLAELLASGWLTEAVEADTSRP
jgi:TRAP-type C4-dicarboxylate transport system permease small subunit